MKHNKINLLQLVALIIFFYVCFFIGYNITSDWVWEIKSYKQVEIDK